jgi:Domain of unknown function (DUF5658)
VDHHVTRLGRSFPGGDQVVNEWVEKHPLLSTFIALQAIDFSTTYLGIQFGVHETNPLVVAIINEIGLVGALVYLKVLGGLMAVKLEKDGKTKSLWRANIIYGVVMCSNVAVVVHYALKHFHK